MIYIFLIILNVLGHCNNIKMLLKAVIEVILNKKKCINKLTVIINII